MDEPKVLIPYDPREAISVPVAAKIANKSEATMRGWCERYFIGRRVVDGPWQVSLIALAALLDEDEEALNAYLGGDRTGPLVTTYYVALGGHSYHPVICHDAVAKYQRRKGGRQPETALKPAIALVS